MNYIRALHERKYKIEITTKILLFETANKKQFTVKIEKEVFFFIRVIKRERVRVISFG